MKAENVADGQSRRILVIEDDSGMRELLARHFRQLGHQVVVATSAEEVQTRGHLSRRWDIVVTDVHLPGLSGIELARRLSERTDSLILVTGDHDPVLFDEAMSQVRAGFLLKPFELFQLDAAIRQAESQPGRVGRHLLDRVWSAISGRKRAAFGQSPRIREAGVPVRALAISLAALALPVIATLMGEPTNPDELILWVSALVPPFMLAQYRGWRGTAIALALGMGTLVFTQTAANYLGMTLPDGQALVGMLFAFITTCLGAGWLSNSLHSFRRKAEAFALTDPLTGLANRAHLQGFLESRFAAGKRRKASSRLAVVFFNIDNFRSWNDELGYDAGDTALVAFADVIRRNTRAMDLAARFGGEEFIVVLSESDYDGAMIYVERVRDSLAQVSLHGRRLTASVGVAFQEPGMLHAHELVTAADAAMFGAKQAGRDCVRVFNTVDESGHASAEIRVLSNVV